MIERGGRINLTAPCIGEAKDIIML